MYGLEPGLQAEQLGLGAKAWSATGYLDRIETDALPEKLRGLGAVERAAVDWILKILSGNWRRTGEVRWFGFRARGDRGYRL